MDNQQRFNNTDSQNTGFQRTGAGFDNTSSGLDNERTSDFGNTNTGDSYNTTSTGTGYGNTGDNDNFGNTGSQFDRTSGGQTGGIGNQSRGLDDTGSSVPGSGFDNNRTNLSDSTGGFNDISANRYKDTSSGGYNDTTTGTGAGGDYRSGNTGIDDSTSKPSMGDKVRGGAEKVMGKVTGNQGMQERGQERKTGGNEY